MQPVTEVVEVKIESLLQRWLKIENESKKYVYLMQLVTKVVEDRK